MTKPVLATIALWVGRVLLAFVFVMAGGHKLAGDPMMVDTFARIGVGQWFRYVTAVIELAAALLVLVPRTSYWGAALMLPVLAGAFAAQLLVLHGDVIHVLVIAAVAGAVAWAQRGDRR